MTTQEYETVICIVCGFVGYNYGSTGTRYLTCPECTPKDTPHLDDESEV